MSCYNTLSQIHIPHMMPFLSMWSRRALLHFSNPQHPHHPHAPTYVAHMSHCGSTPGAAMGVSEVRILRQYVPAYRHMHVHSLWHARRSYYLCRQVYHVSLVSSFRLETILNMFLVTAYSHYFSLPLSITAHCCRLTCHYVPCRLCLSSPPSLRLVRHWL